jgi:hypothetical protein
LDSNFVILSAAHFHNPKSTSLERREDEMDNIEWFCIGVLVGACITMALVVMASGIQASRIGRDRPPDGRE